MADRGDRAPQGVVRVRADNPSPITLDGTNSYVVESWIVDPGPADDGHLAALLEVAGSEPAGIVLTHAHPDHAEGAPALAERAGGVPIVTPGDAEEVGPFRAIATPGHSQDSICLLRGAVCFTGDTILGTGSSLILPGEGSLTAYLDSLRRLRALELDWICPGHGPFVTEPRAKIDEYLDHRLDRERRLLAALDGGARTDDELLDAAWSEVPKELRPAARLTLHAHLEKLRDERRLPRGFGPPATRADAS